MALVTLGVLDQQQSCTAPVGSVGAKAATLARLAHEGIPVPEFFVVPSTALSLHVEANAIAWPGSWDAGRGMRLPRAGVCCGWGRNCERGRCRQRSAGPSSKRTTVSA